MSLSSSLGSYKPTIMNIDWNVILKILTSIQQITHFTRGIPKFIWIMTMILILTLQSIIIFKLHMTYFTMCGTIKSLKFFWWKIFNIQWDFVFYKYLSEGLPQSCRKFERNILLYFVRIFHQKSLIHSCQEISCQKKLSYEDFFCL